ncbi:unnamed protein product [marine sediment metagenome]|uniref:Uncharacterized protein n=1 Tax=marine sediment metagenome TaxID=412755 RepID=X1IM42_9ZZZZ
MFYQEKVLSKDILGERDLSELRKDMKIDMQLDGYYLILGKESIKCSSEVEARYLKIWL